MRRRRGVNWIDMVAAIAKSKAAKGMACPTCGCTTFLQKETRKTGLRIVNGSMTFQEPYSRQGSTLACKNCHAQIPQAMLGKLLRLFEDHSRN